MAIDIARTYMENRLSLDIVKDENRLREEFETAFYPLAANIIEGLGYLNLYVWFDPEYTSPNLMEYSVRDVSQNGDLVVVDDNIYSKEEMDPASWGWFLIPFEQGEYITDPYDWDEYDQQLVSYTKAIEIEGKAVGVVGSDMYIEDLNKRLMSQTFMEHGHYALLNHQLSFIAHPDGNDSVFISDLYTGISEEDLSILRDRAQTEGILYWDEGILGFSRLDNGWIILVIPDQKELFESLDRLSFIYLIIISITIAIIGAFSLLISQSISNPIKQITKMLRDISEGKGDLTQRIRLGKNDSKENEIGQMASYFNRFINDLEHMVQDLINISLSNREMGDTLAANTEEISSSSIEMAASTRSIREQVNLLTQKINSSTENIKGIKEQILLVNENVDKESIFIEESSAAINQMINSINSITRVSADKQTTIKEMADHAGKSSETINEMAKNIIDISNSVDTILDLVTVINDISGQINLLAMNAAIEAAHAGDAGKGFAVVADEIRKLAETTNEQSSNISLSVKSIADKISSTGDNSRDSEKSIQMITDNIRQIAAMINELVLGLTETSGGSKEIVQSLNELVDSSRALADSSSTMNRQSDQVLEDIESINQISRQNMTGVEEFVIGNNEISKAINELAELGTRNHDNIQAMDDKLKQFRVD